ncbi:signal recognition particle protein Srp19 [Methanocalculus taiwanensis]|uniref:Signal recognition particle 19 kDa protein n=1 Tax=Methanocalculus taiwanensis TaxID=106207 RepID=A0ABD4TK60_9EURY|nr:signal recognition particle subunit SRP19/SEC65 family protein [Methanocalculus taiwanensis]MCQ1538569.1 signal recognition particle protein Srp19 [Methanocalculus taiwanensis]
MGTRRILYPCYFNPSLTRAEGRRINTTYALKAPKIQEIERAARQVGATNTEIEPHSHPAHWFRREGRLVLDWNGSKESLIKKVSRKLAERQ